MAACGKPLVQDSALLVQESSAIHGARGAVWCEPAFGASRTRERAPTVTAARIDAAALHRADECALRVVLVDCYEIYSNMGNKNLGLQPK
jgi:hypothetical protein